MPAHPLRIEREQRGWSQARIASALGVSVRTVSRWEQGQTLPYPYYREQLCALFGKNARELQILAEMPVQDTAQAEVVPTTAPTTIPAVASSPAQASLLFDPLIPEALGEAHRLLGRDHLLAQVKQSLFKGDSLALTALHGLPGVGKTAIAVAMATDSDVQSLFYDGILWAGLGADADVLGQLARWGTLLQVAPSEVEDVNSRSAWGRALRAAIGHRRMLLIVDDAWSAEDALAFQLGGPQCAHLLTTRLPQVASAFAMDGLIMVSELEETDGLALLTRTVPQLVQQDPQRALALVRAVGGLPLALKLLGRYLAAQAFTRQPRRLQTALAQLQNAVQRLKLSLPLERPERPDGLPIDAAISLQAVIAVSDQYLSKQAHGALCTLGVFPAKPNSFSEEAALAVSQQSVDVLDELWDAGLLESSGPGRYTLHQTIADYASAQNQDVNGALLQLTKYMLGYVLAHEQDYKALELETGNLLAALDATISLQQRHELIQGATALTSFWRVRGLYKQAEHYLQQAWDAALTLEDQAAQVSILRHRAAFAELRADYPQAEAAARQGLTLARQVNQLGEVSALLTILGNVARQRGEHVQARAWYEEGLAQARQLGKSELICTLLSSLGWVCWSQGIHSQAEAFCQEGLALARQEGLPELVVMLLTTLGFIAVSQSKFVLAEQYAQEGLALARQLGHREHLAHVLSTLGAIAGYQGKYDQAETSFQEALALVRQIGNRAQICLILSNLGELTILQGDCARAERYLQEGLELARQLGSQADLPYLLMNLGNAIGQQGDYDRANAYLQESADLARQQGASWDLGFTLATWGEIHLKYQQMEAATSAFNEVLALNNDAERDPHLLARAQYGLAQILASHGDTAEARRLGQQSLLTLEEMKHFKASEVRQWLEELQPQS